MTPIGEHYRRLKQMQVGEKWAFNLNLGEDDFEKLIRNVTSAGSRFREENPQRYFNTITDKENRRMFMERVE